jgi:hypothetical protein
MIVLHDPNGSHPTLAALAVLRDEDSLCDVELVVSDGVTERSFRAHRCVLAATSDYFRALLLGERFADSASPKLAISEVSPSCLEAAIDFMYSGVAHVCETHLVRMLGVAARLQVRCSASPAGHPVSSSLKHCLFPTLGYSCDRAASQRSHGDPRPSQRSPAPAAENDARGGSCT